MSEQPEVTAAEPVPVPPEAPDSSAQAARILRSNPARLAELRATYSGRAAPVSAPAPNVREWEMYNKFIRNPDGSILVHVWKNAGWTVDLWDRERCVGTGHGETIRAAYTEAWRELRMNKHDKGDLLRRNAELRSGLALTLAGAAALISEFLSVRTERDAARDMYNALDSGLMFLMPESTHDPENPARTIENVRKIIEERDALRTVPEDTNLREGLNLVRQTLADVGQPSGSLPNRIKALAADRDRWRKRAETSAASYRALSGRVPADQQDRTVEVVRDVQ